MQLTSLIFTCIFFLSSLVESFFFFPLRPIGPPPPPPAPQCQGHLQFKPLGSFLLGPLFPNPWKGLGGNFNIPNCNAPPPPAPSCPVGEACRPPPPAPTPWCPTGQSCQLPPRQPTFPTQQAAADTACNPQGGSALRACLDPAGIARRCCAA